MKKFTLSLILDTLFCFFLAFFTVLTILSFFIRTKLSLILSLIIAFLIGVLAFILLKSKRDDKILKKDDELKKESVLYNLFFLTNKEIKRELEKALILIGLETSFSGDKLTADGYKIVCNFSFNELTKSDIAKVYKTNKGKTALFCNKADKDAITLAEKLKIEIVDANKTYLLFKKANYYPEIKVTVAKEKIKLKDFLSFILLKKNAKNYLLTAVGLFFLSFFTFYKFYYVLFGLIFAILSIIAKFYGNDLSKNA